MTIINPFTAIFTKPQYANQLIFNNELKHILKSDEKTEYLDLIIAEGYLTEAQLPALYIYQVEESGHKQTGVWTQTIPGEIKIHEHILPEKINRIRNFRTATGIEAKPVLLTYLPDEGIKQLISSIVENLPTETYQEGLNTHRIWQVADNEIIAQLQSAFAKVNDVYMADGHHRLKANPFSSISALYMDTKAIKVKPYHRIIRSEIDLNKYFIIEKSDSPVLPTEKNHFGLLTGNQWYHLISKTPMPFDMETLSALFSDIEYTPEPITDNPEEMLFTLCPLSIAEVIQAADAGVILPPKSTWIEPKIPYGLLLHRHTI